MILQKYRWPAEWEPQAAVQLTFPHADTDWADTLDTVLPCFVHLAEAISRFAKVMVVCADAAQTAASLAHIDADRLILIEAPSNDTWVRDYGGIMVHSSAGWTLLDFMFNGWGLKFAADQDNRLTHTLHRQGIFGRLPRKVPGLVLEGGSIDTDGAGTILTTEKCLLSPNRNPHLSRPELGAMLNTWLGAERMLWLDRGGLVGDDTDAHIDTLARFCDPTTITYVQCTDANDEHYTALRQMEAQLRSFRTRADEPYRLVPLPLPTACYAADGHRLPATYANFLIINEGVLVPTYNVPEDEVALATLQEIFPEKQVVPVNCRPLIEQHGSLHCVTMQYPYINPDL